ncbi:hypothetical protein [Sneathiella litorea]|uniref:Flagellar basal-body protein FlbY n=1 Tax=Sneathiella litorea TaxID=2606216 RepID=A0A6L8W6T2_9PROT|nr:hypothetical protein [Sneathiella litorea]MZR30811.1 hypothetical protein [Sneathiella litorea]
MTAETQNNGPVLMKPDALARLIARLSDILEQENKLLHENNPEGFKATLNEKTRLIATYNQQMTLVKKNPDSFKAFPKSEIDHLKKTSEDFYTVLDRHFRKLSTARTVTEGLVKSVADEVAKKKAPPRGYTARAAVADPLSNRNARAVNGAIAINQVI